MHIMLIRMSCVCTIVAHFAEFTFGLMKINSGQLVCLANAAIVLISW